MLTNQTIIGSKENERRNRQNHEKLFNQNNSGTLSSIFYVDFDDTTAITIN